MQIFLYSLVFKTLCCYAILIGDAGCISFLNLVWPCSFQAQKCWAAEGVKRRYLDPVPSRFDVCGKHQNMNVFEDVIGKVFWGARLPPKGRSNWYIKSNLLLLGGCNTLAILKWGSRMKSLFTRIDMMTCWCLNLLCSIWKTTLRLFHILSSSGVSQLSSPSSLGWFSFFAPLAAQKMAVVASMETSIYNTVRGPCHRKMRKKKQRMIDVLARLGYWI